jgi:hypothetical protein
MLKKPEMPIGKGFDSTKSRRKAQKRVTAEADGVTSRLKVRH